MGKKIVVALGHSALGKTFPEQKEAVKNAASAIADLVEAKYDIVITHSNGTQVGMIHSAMREYSRLEPTNTVAPMSICSAMSQGYIGYDLQNEIRTELLNRGIYKPVSTIITQVRVDPFDTAFSYPTKEIGRYMTAEEAKAEEEKGNHVVEIEGKGYKRVIAAPRPMEIYETDAIKTLMDAGQIVIAAGGGGIPVLQQGTRLKGASAVIEKMSQVHVLPKNLEQMFSFSLPALKKSASTLALTMNSHLTQSLLRMLQNILQTSSLMKAECFQKLKQLSHLHLHQKSTKQSLQVLILHLMEFQENRYSYHLLKHNSIQS